MGALTADFYGDVIDYYTDGRDCPRLGDWLGRGDPEITKIVAKNHLGISFPCPLAICEVKV